MSSGFYAPQIIEIGKVLTTDSAEKGGVLWTAVRKLPADVGGGKLIR